MTRDDIISMAMDAGCNRRGSGRDHFAFDTAGLIRFAEFVAAAERERMVAEGWRQSAHLAAHKETINFGRSLGAKEEREACVNIIDAYCFPVKPTSKKLELAAQMTWDALQAIRKSIVERGDE